METAAHLLNKPRWVVTRNGVNTYVYQETQEEARRVFVNHGFVLSSGEPIRDTTENHNDA